MPPPADDLGDELPDVAKEQTPGNRAAVVHRAIGKQSERQLTPQAIDAMYRDGANRIVDLERSKNGTARHTSTPAIAPMMKPLNGLTKPLGAVIATSPASRPLPIMAGSGFLLTIQV